MCIKEVRGQLEKSYTRWRKTNRSPAIQAGWWLAEVGRQPWILRGIMTIDEAANRFLI